MGNRIQVHLVDGTYELFRDYFAVPSLRDSAGNERGAVVGVIQSLLGLLEGGATHVGVATDHVIESFRNRLFPGYKTGEGVDPVLLAQFGPLEEAVAALGVPVWPMVELEADDALAAAAASAESDPRVERVFLCTPDKDLAQCVRGDRVVQLDRRSGEVRTEPDVVAKFGVAPASIPDYLALVGDSADGYPGLPGWGHKSASVVLARYGRLEAVPAEAGEWDVPLRGAAKLARVLGERREEAVLYRTLATLRRDEPAVKVDDLAFRGPTPEFENLAARWGRLRLAERARALRRSRG